MTVAQRFTTEYADYEDRIRISHQLESEKVVVTWLTRRLTDRLVAHLAGWLEKETEQTPRPEVLQSFAQEAAAAELAQASAAQPQEAVKPPPSPTQWLVREIDINTQPEGAGLLFRGQTPEEKLQLNLTKLQLRQWLNIVRSQYLVAQWPMSAWPDWLQPSAAGTTQSAPSAPLH
jgi:hypothetical protein